MTITPFVARMRKAGWEPSGGWIPEELLDTNGVYDAEFCDKKGKLMFVKSSTMLAMEPKKFAAWIKRTEKEVIKPLFLKYFDFIFRIRT